MMTGVGNSKLTVAVALTVGSALLVATKVMTWGNGIKSGAVYWLLITVPTTAFPPGTPLTVHVKPQLDVFFRARENLSLSPSLMVELVGDRVIVTGRGGGGLVRVTQAVAETLGSVTDDTVILIGWMRGILVGAL